MMHPSSLAHRSFKRILLVKPSSLGDVVHALPVLHGLRARYPQARIDWLIASRWAELLESHPDLDELVVFDRRRYGRIGRSVSVTHAFLGFLHDLRARQYDLVIDLQGLLRTGFLTRATGAGVRLGFRHAREGAWAFYNYRLLIPSHTDMHAVDCSYHVAELLGFADVPVRFNLALSDGVRAEAMDLLRDGGLAATIEQFPGGQAKTALGAMVDLLRKQTKPEPLVLLTPIAITKDNIDKAERLGEVQ